MSFYFFQYNNLFLINSLLAIIFNLNISFSQDSTNVIELNEVDLKTKMSYSFNDYYFYEKKVLKVYHYVDTLSLIISKLDTELNFEKKKRLKKKIIRKYRNELMNRFLNQIKSLTRKEGVILCKLIYRKNNITVFSLIRKYRGSWNAFWWQRLSKIYEGDLKSSFYPKKNKEDFLIEKVIENNFLF